MKPGDTHGLCLWLRSTGAILGSGLLEVNVSGVMGQGATSLQSSLYRLWLTDLEATIGSIAVPFWDCLIGFLI